MKHKKNYPVCMPFLAWTYRIILKVIVKEGLFIYNTASIIVLFILADYLFALIITIVQTVMYWHQ